MELKSWFDHGLGDCVHWATYLQLYRRRGYRVQVHHEANKAGVFQAAGCEFTPDCINHSGFHYHPGFNHPKPSPDWSGNKLALCIKHEDTTPPLGDLDDVWDEICAVNLEDSFDPIITPEIQAEVDRFLGDLPRPIVCIHSKGTNFQFDKSIQDGVVADLYRELLNNMSGSLVLLDWDMRVPSPPHGRIRHLKRDWGHISVTHLACLLNNSSLLIGIDSGPYHLAAMTHCPALGIFTGFYPSCVTLPRASLKNVVMTQEVHRPVSVARRKRWSPVEYRGHHPSAGDIARHALRMLAGPRYGLPLGRDVMLQQMIRDWCSASTSTSSLADRNNSFDFLFRRMAKFDNPQILETGCVRSDEDWSAGMSTYLFGAYLDGRGSGRLVSVDLNGANCATARRICLPWSERVTVAESDSVAFLVNRTEPVDVLYLDSLDCEDPNHSTHGLAEVQAAERLLTDQSIVVFDDTVFTDGKWKGKGALAVPYLRGKGWKCVFAGYQTIMERGN